MTIVFITYVYITDWKFDGVLGGDTFCMLFEW